jgi:hypothetical protein
MRRLMGVSTRFNVIDGVEMLINRERDVASVTGGSGSLGCCGARELYNGKLTK